MADTEAPGPSNVPSNLLTQFRDICAVDEDVARRFLDESAWNLEAAVHLYFHSNDPEAIENQDNQQQELRQRRNVPTAQPSQNNQNAGGPAAVVPHRRQPTWTDWFRGLLTMPFRLFWWSIREAFTFVFSFLGLPPLSLTDPRQEVLQFREEIEPKVAESGSAIAFFNGSYNDAIAEARNSVRFLIVYLHNPSHQRTEDFLTNYLLTQRFKSFMDNNDCFLWGASVRSSEGYKVATALRELTYPCIALLCMRDNRMACVLRLAGDYTIDSMFDSLQTAVDENRRFLNAIANERAQRELNNRLRREQEADYERSLQADRARLNERRRLESERIEAQRREEEERQREEQKQQRFAAKRDEIRAQLQQQDKATTNGSAAPDQKVRVSVRFPDGAKFDHAFHLDDSLEALFNATLVHERCPADFALLSSYPRTELNCAPEWYREFGSSVQDPTSIPTFRASGLERSVVVLVRDNQA
ncbi:UBX domain containing protein [Aphelenchoides avenae]|nr:UBX domain containing protein [Aphelenchus avenae]